MPSDQHLEPRVQVGHNLQSHQAHPQGTCTTASVLAAAS